MVPLFTVIVGLGATFRDIVFETEQLFASLTITPKVVVTLGDTTKELLLGPPVHV